MKRNDAREKAKEIVRDRLDTIASYWAESDEKFANMHDDDAPAGLFEEYQEVQAEVIKLVNRMFKQVAPK